MRIHLDEDMTAVLLTRLLMNAGHDVRTAADAGLLGRSDPVQLTAAILDNRVILTANYRDYEELHFLLRAACGNHPGILVVRRENDPAKNLTAKGIVNAIRKLEAATVPTLDDHIILNHWR